MCNSSSVSLCAGGSGGKKWLYTQFINKSLPAPDTYPVRIFVDVTYYSYRCMPHCHHDILTNCTNCDMPHRRGGIELLVSHADSGEYTGDGITPKNVITYNETKTTKQFYFNTSSVFSLALQATEACVTVSRVLVYRYECAGHDRLPTGLSRRPPTQAPDSGSVRVNPYCADHAHISAANGQNKLLCQYNGTWLNEQPQCVCDEGYNEDVDTCQGKHK